jgi:hypothetical protein
LLWQARLRILFALELDDDLSLYGNKAGGNPFVKKKVINTSVISFRWAGGGAD